MFVLVGYVESCKAVDFCVVVISNAPNILAASWLRTILR